jgi:hypothetical protein
MIALLDYGSGNLRGVYAERGEFVGMAQLNADLRRPAFAAKMLA